ncbi:glycosyltransferase family 2 protein [Actinobacillus lignieresii]|uniref:Lipooligosaccharide biosynthesis protein n=1 Tax=Actinobacillus lignieresii TaxID=720 RepID=A0A380U3Z2_ACTLI|nr:glycosyltransferase family 2 protein [Actinobacillus lignieresii]SUT94963.1 Putative lipooligosaccharide biosynthesis protein [Actinobacillus lignieresii]
MKLLKKLFGRNKLEQPLISILVPCYNSRKTLPATLKSIQQSNYKNLDVMIVDDGHEVTVEDIVSSFNDPRFRYFYKKNEGLGLTRNFGIENAKGEFIFFLDSDDLIYPDAFSNLINYMLENNLDVVSGVTVRRDFETNVESEWFRSLYKINKISTFENRLSQFDDSLSTNKLYRVKTLQEHNIYFETGLYEDKLFTAKLYSKVAKIGLINNRVYVWLIYGNATSITTSKSVSNFKGRMEAINNLWQYIPELRKAYQIAFYMNHDLLIYLREFEFYSEEEKDEIYNIAYEFIQKHKAYVYKRLVSNSWNRACLDALCEGNKEKFIYTANTLSKVFQEELSRKQRV